MGPEDARPVLLMHGNPSWGFLYRKVVADLLATTALPLRLVVTDLVGLGCSDKARDASLHTLENHGRWMGAVIDAPSPRATRRASWGAPPRLPQATVTRTRGGHFLQEVPGPIADAVRDVALRSVRRDRAGRPAS